MPPLTLQKRIDKFINKRTAEVEKDEGKVFFTRAIGNQPYDLVAIYDFKEDDVAYSTYGQWKETVIEFIKFVNINFDNFTYDEIGKLLASFNDEILAKNILIPTTSKFQNCDDKLRLVDLTGRSWGWISVTVDSNYLKNPPAIQTGRSREDAWIQGSIEEGRLLSKQEAEQKRLEYNEQLRQQGLRS